MTISDFEKITHDSLTLSDVEFDNNFFKDLLNDKVQKSRKLKRSQEKEIYTSSVDVDGDFNFFEDLTIDNNIIQSNEYPKVIDSTSIELVSFNSDFSSKFDTEIRTSLENEMNLKREETLKKEFTNILIDCLIEEDFEFGFKTRSESIIKEQLSINALATRNWLNEIFIDNFENEKILIGILRIIGRFDEEIIFPQGQTMALAALVHTSDEIKELGIRAFENWNSNNSLRVLKNLDVESKWLKDYLDQVIQDLSEEYEFINS